MRTRVPERHYDPNSIPGKARSAMLNSGAPSGWVMRRTVPSTEDLVEPGDALVYAVISTWMDGDIIAANVRNCFANGVSRVYLLDNASQDNSVAAGCEAGAIVGEIYETKFYDDDLRIRKQNELMRRVTEDEKHKDLWWLALDADEFVTGRGGEPLAVTLSRIPRSVRTVGQKAVDLYPQSPDEYVVGEHPAKCMKFGVNRTAYFACKQRHWKHVPLRYFDGVYDIGQTRGNHFPSSKSRSTLVPESQMTLTLFHAPLRRREDAERRLEMLCGKKKNLGGKSRSAGDDQVIHGEGAIKRWNSLRHIYAGEWDQVEYPHAQMYGRSVRGLALYEWRVLSPDLCDLFKEPVLEPA